MASTRVAGFAQRLPSARYLLITTYRKDGTPVPTPVWFVRDGSRLLVWTDARSGKVRRIRHDHRVTVRTCTLRGKPTSAAAEATVSVLPPEQGPAVQRLLDKRYGLMMWLYRAYARRASTAGTPAYLAIHLTDEAAARPSLRGHGGDRGPIPSRP